VQTQPELRSTYGCFVGGEWRDAAGGGTYDLVDPSAGTRLATAARGGADDVAAAVAAATESAARWAETPALKRGRALRKVADALRAALEPLAQLESRNSGKVIDHARADVLSAAQYFEFYGGLAAGIEGETVPSTRSGAFTYTLREPYGVTGHILPWNFPIVVAARSLAPALAAGNAAVIKPAEETPITCLELAGIATACGVPPGVVNVVTGLGEEAGAALAAHPGVPRLTFTGSVETGKLVLTAAAQHVCDVTVELGGKSPHVIFADADVDRAARDAVTAITTHSGQICSAGSRLLVEASVHDEVVERIVEMMDRLTPAPALDGGPMGPLVSAAQRDRVLGYLDAGVADGAVLRTRPAEPGANGDGYFVRPAVFDEVTPEMRIAREEIFGPVLTVTTFEGEDEAVALANDSSFGLAAGVWTRDIDRAMRMARRLQAGTVYINGYFGGGIELPFGGSKDSGFGRENGRQALNEYSTVKSVCISFQQAPGTSR
jgi:aldehyde dehydrogenase (NAD+)